MEGTRERSQRCAWEELIQVVSLGSFVFELFRLVLLHHVVVFHHRLGWGHVCVAHMIGIDREVRAGVDWKVTVGETRHGGGGIFICGGECRDWMRVKGDREGWRDGSTLATVVGVNTRVRGCL
uniref:Uncharacterized protein n=1 Tax=Cacopsylla melanoneura TaxID=428564 RepID=A0A8D8UPK2_9HEMI